MRGGGSICEEGPPPTGAHIVADGAAKRGPYETSPLLRVRPMALASGHDCRNGEHAHGEFGHAKCSGIQFGCN